MGVSLDIGGTPGGGRTPFPGKLVRDHRIGGVAGMSCPPGGAVWLVQPVGCGAARKGSQERGFGVQAGTALSRSRRRSAWQAEIWGWGIQGWPPRPPCPQALPFPGISNLEVTVHLLELGPSLGPD